MAKFGCFKNGYISIAGVDMSDHCTEFTVDEGQEELKNDTHGGVMANVIPGLGTWTLKAKFLQDFAAGSIHFTLRNAKESYLPVAMYYRASQGAVSATNPMYSGSAYVMSYTGFGGAHGVNLMADVTLRPASSLPLVEILTP